ncbi:hypothetical protein [Streptomyces sp. NPDC058240]|uniref:hypothetical protein n=1 Tax=Streptomyces sp. NPDC058240 TaxID=3346396 RepID=UPI0036EBCBDE
MATMSDGADRLAADQSTATARLVAPVRVREEFPDLMVSEHIVHHAHCPVLLVPHP